METLNFKDIKKDTGENPLHISEGAVENNTEKHKESDTNDARDVRIIMRISWDKYSIISSYIVII